MSAQASPKKPIVINVDHQMPKDAFLDICKSSLELANNMYAIVLVFSDVSFHCTVWIGPGGDPDCFHIYFYNTNKPTKNVGNVLDPFNEEIFMYLVVANGVGDSAITTLIPFNTVKGMRPLETVIYMRCLFYWMIEQEWYTIEDAAKGSCDVKKASYPLFMYRTLTPKDNGQLYKVSELSIYYRYFAHQYFIDEHETPRQRINLDDPKYAAYLQAIRDKYADYVPFARNTPDCAKRAKELSDEDMRSTLHKNKNQAYTLLYKEIGKFLVRNQECIYYPKSSPKKSPKLSPKGAANAN